MQDAFNAVRDAIGEVTGIDKYDIQQNQKPRADLGMDSLDMLEIATLLEEKFYFRFSDADLMDITDNPRATVGDYVKMVEKYLPQTVQQMKIRRMMSQHKIKTR